MIHEQFKKGVDHSGIARIQLRDETDAALRRSSLKLEQAHPPLRSRVEGRRCHNPPVGLGKRMQYQEQPHNKRSGLQNSTPMTMAIKLTRKV